MVYALRRPTTRDLKLIFILVLAILFFVTVWILQVERKSLFTYLSTTAGQNPGAASISKEDMDQMPLWTITEEWQRAFNSNSTLVIPRIIHQSWKTKVLPKKFDYWKSTCSATYPDWHFQLWTDEENLQFIKHYFPFFFPTYERFSESIFRADAVRYAYLFLFGGMYFDLDTECLRPMDDFFSTSSFSRKGVYLSVMDTKEVDRTSSIPNAWMASSPGHPFWLLMLANIMHFYQVGGKDGKGIAEDITGPIALYATVEQYNTLFPNANDLHLIKEGKIYPFSWSTTSTSLDKICGAMHYSFDATACKKHFSNLNPFMITYWTHTRKHFISPILDQGGDDKVDDGKSS